MAKHIITLRRIKARLKKSQHGPPTKLPVPALKAYLSTRRLFRFHDLCLGQSIGLFHHLAQRGYCATLVIGVRMGPFSAHAWLQSDDVILNDTVDGVRPYTPIFVL